MLVYQTDADGYYIGPVEADESPLEPGVYLIPRLAVETEPPETEPGQRAYWNGSEWLLDPSDASLIAEIELAKWRATAKVSRFQARAALLGAGLLTSIETAVANSGNAFAQLAWADAIEFRRNSPTIAALAGLVGLTDEELDDLFLAAAEIEA